VFCISDAFTKDALVTAISNKEAETVADVIYKKWFSKFGILAQIHTDEEKEFVYKLSAEIFELLNISHIKTLPAHPKCNAHVEVFNKTLKKFLPSFVNNTTLKWETFLPALALSYNKSHHSTIQTTPFELILGEKHGFLHSLMKTSKKFITVKCLQQKDLTFYNNYKNDCMNLLQKRVPRLKCTLADIHMPINSKLVTKCPFQIWQISEFCTCFSPIKVVKM
jgi:hypothetical protein